ncbi:DUF4177 domain-containing protein [Gymnodinialimonas sp. 2305UL16-5]|uniref:DUF4177 domain-containing protein n=1 Tax=Gymnodinialimonas mytili TaxID=3126503 RepID=UPI0030A5CEED
MEDLMNDLAADGWSYLRADTLPQEERSGLTSKTTTFRNLLVFQREIPTEPYVAPQMQPPVVATREPEPVAAAETAPAPSEPQTQPDPEAEPQPQRERDDAEESPLFSALRATRESRVAPAAEDGKPLFPNRQGERVDL